ncbi:MAG: Hsp20/alpha crystallin family protein [Gammaproteobacteria bacterium]|nr:Hsp20/alpha crystallin family protein [Gammaproteobacteria bacterium]
MMRTPEREASREVSRHEESQATLWPPADIFEDSSGITLLLDMPGVSRERLDVTVDGNRLLVEGDMKIDIDEKMESLHADINASHFSRAFSSSGEQLDTGQHQRRAE